MRILLTNKENGFTLIELMIVMAIIGTLTAIAIPNYFSYRQKTLVTEAVIDIKRIEKEIVFYQMDHVDPPASLAEIGLDSLLDPWGRPYQYLRMEPSRREKVQIYEYKPAVIVRASARSEMYSMYSMPASDSPPPPDRPLTPRKDHNLVPVNTDYDLYSMGPDGESRAPFTAKASRDDIVRANNGQFVGLVSNY